MKRYIRSAYYIENDWKTLVREIESETGLRADPHWATHPTTSLSLYDSNGNIAAIAYTEINRDGTYEWGSTSGRLKKL